MRCVLYLLVFLSATISSPAIVDESAMSAQQIIDEYLALPCPVDDRIGEARIKRLKTLRQLATKSDEAVSVIAETLVGLDLPVHRRELIEILGRITTQSSAELLISFIHDPDPGVRRNVIQSLRLLASRIKRSGAVDVPPNPQHPSQVEGLVPHLIEAAEDENIPNRTLALFALADTRAYEAKDELHRRLVDYDPSVRFTAACLLTEFGDSTGLPILREALDRLVRQGIRAPDSGMGPVLERT